MTKGYAWRSVNAGKARVSEALKGKKTAIVFDTETTGIPGGRIREEDIKIIQFSAILYDLSASDGAVSLAPRDYLNLYINPEELIDKNIETLTGITNEMLGNAETEEKAVWKIRKFMEQSDLWIGYNTAYDIKRLQGMGIRTKTEISLPAPAGTGPFTEKSLPQNAPVFIDVLEIARDIVDPEAVTAYKKKEGISGQKMYKLDILVPMLLPGFEASFHNSLDDVQSTAKLFEFLYPEYMKLNMPCGNKKLAVKKFSFKSANPHAYMKNRRLIIYTEPVVKSPGVFAEDCGIYWDVPNSCFSCRTKTKQDPVDFKKLFLETDLEDLERQVLALADAQRYRGTNEFARLSMDNIVYEAEKRWRTTSEGKRIMNQVSRLGKEKRKEKKLAKEAEEFAEIELD